MRVRWQSSRADSVLVWSQDHDVKPLLQPSLLVDHRFGDEDQNKSTVLYPSTKDPAPLRSLTERTRAALHSPRLPFRTRSSSSRRQDSASPPIASFGKSVTALSSPWLPQLDVVNRTSGAAQARRASSAASPPQPHKRQKRLLKNSKSPREPHWAMTTAA